MQITILIAMVFALVAFILFWAAFTGRTRSQWLPVTREEFRLRPEVALDDEEESKEVEELYQPGTLRVRLNEAGLPSITPAEFIGLSIITGAVPCFVVYGVLSAPYLAAAIGVAGAYLPTLWVNRRRAQMREKLEMQIEQVAQNLHYLMKAGYSLSGAIESLAEMDAPIGPEFERLLVSIRAGKPLAEALVDMRDRISHEGMNLMVVAMLVHLETGSELAPVLQEIAKLMRRNIELRASIKAKFSQPQASYFFVAGLAVPMFFYWLIMRADLVRELYSTTFGQVLLIFLGVWAILGYQIMKRLATLEAAM